MEKATIIIGAVVGVLLAMCVLALPTMLLWNWLMPVIFGLIKINFWQALGLNVLSSIFFKTFSLK